MPYLWKSMRAGLKSKHGNIKWEKGKWFKHDGELSLYNSGFHASKNIIDAIGFVDCEILARVEVRGESIIGEDKQVWSEMKIVDTYEWTKEDSARLAVYASEIVIDIFEEEYPDDKRPREAILAAKAFIKNPTEENRIKCYQAAWAAARVAWVAWVAWATAEAARAAEAAEAARAAWAARAAARVAWVARAEIEKKCHNYILRIIREKKLVATSKRTAVARTTNV